MVRLLPGRGKHALAGVYALNALTGTELGRFERHLDDCESCQAEVRSLHETAGELAVAVSAAPPAGLRARVLTAVPSVAQLPALPDSARPPRPRLARAVPAIAIGVAAVATAVAVVLGVRLSSVENQLSVSKAEQQALTRLLNTPGVRVLAMTTTRGGEVTAVHVPGQRRVVVLTRNLPALRSGKVYQVWLIGRKGVSTRSAGLLGRPVAGLTTLLANGEIRGDTVGITVEPAGGTAQPTTMPIVLIPLRG